MSVTYQVTRGCTFCGGCVMECPREAIQMTRHGARIDAQRCIGCGICYENCASEAIQRLSGDARSTPQPNPSNGDKT